MISQNWGGKKTKEPLLMSCSLKFRENMKFTCSKSLGKKIVYLVENNLPGTHNNFCLTFSTFWMCLLQQTFFKFSSSFCNNTRWLGEEVTSISTKEKRITTQNKVLVYYFDCKVHKHFRKCSWRSKKS